MPAEVRRHWDLQLQQHLLAWCEQHRPASLAVYSPIQAEPDLRACYAQLSKMGIQLALPWVVEKHTPLRFLAWQEGDAMALDEYGIPLPAQRERLLSPAALLMPCVGFNVQGYRLGYGGGYYDRTLAGLPACIALGVAYQCAASDFVAGVHDIPMHHLLTEQGMRELL